MIIQVYDDDLLNGEGLREVIFLQGCPHHCKGCFNSETWEFKEDTKESALKDLAYLAKVDYKLQQSYISGITISGGEPLVSSNLKTTLQLIDLAKSHGKTVWVYSGYTWEELMERRNNEDMLKEVLENIDVLCEGRFKEALKSPNKPWVGSANQRVIDVKKSLKKGNYVLFNSSKE